MVYKVFIKKNGKLIGPYYYKSYRVGNKVKKRYFGRRLPKRYLAKKTKRGKNER